MAKFQGAVTRFLAERYGGVFGDRDSTVTIGVAAGEIVQADSERTSLVIVNHGAADIVVSNIPGMTITQGIRLYANGGFLALNVSDDDVLPSLAWYGISAAAGNTVWVKQTRREHIQALGEGGP